MYRGHCRSPWFVIIEYAQAIVMIESREELHALLNAQTGKIGWPELQPHFARGVVIRVAPEMDLVEVAVCFARDEKDPLKQWMEQGLVAKATDADAKDWLTRSPLFWAVVSAPFVLVQEVAP